MKKDKLTVCGFLGILCLTALLHVLCPDQTVSAAERRRLTGLPKLHAASIEDTSFMNSFESYLKDQFPGRELFRRVAAFLTTDIFLQKDYHDYYLWDGSICKLEYPLNESSISNAATLFHAVSEKYFQNERCYYAVIPDKNYFAAEKEDIPAMDYDRLFDLLHESMGNRVEEISIREKLASEDYYRTDLHWRQENLAGVADQLLESMDAGKTASDYECRKATASYEGTYFGQYPLWTGTDQINYLTNESISSTVVYDYEADLDAAGPVYVPEKLAGNDAYDFFLSGARALLVLERENTEKNVEADRTLVLFRDSFGSSLAPLFLDSYSRIIMIDLRYVSADTAMELVDIPENRDVLFLYSTTVLNHSDSFKR